MYNSCNKPVRLYFKRAGSDLQTSLNTSTHTEERATDGDVIQLMDDTGRKELHRVTIAPSTKEVVVVSGCLKLEAR
jgi:hypothetical protein